MAELSGGKGGPVGQFEGLLIETNSVGIGVERQRVIAGGDGISKGRLGKTGQAGVKGQFGGRGAILLQGGKGLAVVQPATASRAVAALPASRPPRRYARALRISTARKVTGKVAWWAGWQEFTVPASGTTRRHRPDCGTIGGMAQNLRQLLRS